MPDEAQTLIEAGYGPVEVVQDDCGRGGGNRLYRLGEAPDTVLLKVYAQRRSGWQEQLQRFSHRWVEGKRDVTAAARHATERELITRWTRAGFDVPKLCDPGIPETLLAAPFLVIEDCAGPLLYEVLADAAQPWSDRAALFARFAADLGRRFRRATGDDEVRLVHEHGTVRHVLVHAGRLVTFDLEGAFSPGFSVREALTQELSGHLRSIAKAVGEAHVDRAFSVLAAAFGDKALLADICGHGVRSGGVSRLAKRWADRRRRPRYGKIAMLERLEAQLG